MQKYYHKGAFYMDTTSIKNKSDDVRVKDYASIPTLEDKVDKEKLPAILQVCNIWLLDVLWNEMYEWYNITTTNSFIPNQYSI